MSEWWSYRLADFLLFSPRVYYRLFELHNRALWPIQVLTLALGLVMLLLLLRPARWGQRLIPALLGVLWLWVAWAFFWERYATINWASAYVAALFAVEGLALLWLGAVREQLAFAGCGGARALIGTALFGGALLAYPLLAPLMGRPWSAAELFGIAPDPTAVATLAALTLAHGRACWVLLPVPCLWCAMTGATLWALEAGDFYVAPAGALVAAGLVLTGSNRGRAGAAR